MIRRPQMRDIRYVHPNRYILNWVQIIDGDITPFTKQFKTHIEAVIFLVNLGELSCC